jgi:hypothetical protein
VSRFALLLLSSALMLVIAACDANGDDDAADDIADDTTELPADDQANGEDDFAAPEEDDEVGMEDDDFAAEPEDDAATEPEGDDAVTEPEDDEDMVEPDDEEMAADDEMAIDDEDAAIDPEDMEPDPEQGMFFDLSFEEANDMTEFEVREPEHVPEALEFVTIMGMASMEAAEEEMNEEAATITFAYEQAPEDEMMQGLPVEFMQSTEIDMSEGLGPDAEAEETTIGDREVTHITMMANGDEINAWVWEEDGVNFSLAAILGEDLSQEDLEEMIASVPAA